MRRIIERVVTVVTTTTWKISWEAETPQVEPGPDSVSMELPSQDIPSEPERHDPVVIGIKEVDPPGVENSPEQLP